MKKRLLIFSIGCILISCFCLIKTKVESCDFLLDNIEALGSGESGGDRCYGGGSIKCNGSSSYSIIYY